MTPHDVSSPEELAALLDGKRDEEVEQVLVDLGIDASLARIFESMAQRFLPHKAGGRRAVVQWKLQTPEGSRAYVLTIEGERCVHEQGVASTPDVTLGAQVPVFLRVIAGRVNGLQAFANGELRVEGDQTLALVQQLWFDTDLSQARLDISTPSELARLIQGRSDDDIRAGMQVTGVDKSLHQVFQGMVEHYLPKKGPRKRSVVEFDIRTPDGGRTFQLVADHSGSSYQEGRKEKPNVKIAVDVPDFMRMVAGKLDGIRALTQGKLKVKGNILLARGVQSWFDMSR